MWCTGLVAPQHVGSSQTRLKAVPALTGGFLSTVPLGKSCHNFLRILSIPTYKENLTSVFPLVSHSDHTLSTSDTRCVGVFPTPSKSCHQLGVLQFNSILTISTPRDNFRSQRPRAQSHKTAPSPLQMPDTSPGC